MPPPDRLPPPRAHIAHNRSLFDRRNRPEFERHRQCGCRVAVSDVLDYAEPHERPKFVKPTYQASRACNLLSADDAPIALLETRTWTRSSPPTPATGRLPPGWRTQPRPCRDRRVRPRHRLGPTGRLVRPRPPGRQGVRLLVQTPGRARIGTLAGAGKALREDRSAGGPADSHPDHARRSRGRRRRLLPLRGPSGCASSRPAPPKPPRWRS